MNRSPIEWTDRTVNFHRGCSRVSEGCRLCYAERIATRFSGEQAFQTFAERKDGQPHWTGKVELLEDELRAALRWTWPARFYKEHGRKPRVFSPSMSDPFHEGFSASSIGRFLALTQMRQDINWQVLTKRAERMFEVCRPDSDVHGWMMTHLHEWTGEWGDSTIWPLSNVDFGVSVEDQPAADEIIKFLLQTPAAVRFVSHEPALGAVNFNRIEVNPPGAGGTVFIDALRGTACSVGGQWDVAKLDWIICGGESGPGARPMHPDWARSVRDQCVAAGVPFFFKQWGAWTPATAEHGVTGSLMPDTGEQYTWIGLDGETQNPSAHGLKEPVMAIARVGKKAAGRLLDGREWNEFPNRCYLPSLC